MRIVVKCDVTRQPRGAAWVTVTATMSATTARRMRRSTVLSRGHASTRIHVRMRATRAMSTHPHPGSNTPARVRAMMARNGTTRGRPLGVELKENIRTQWWRSMVTAREDVVGLDSSIILPRQTWVASGHVGEFTDPLTECLSCHKRFRVDHLQEAVADREAKKGRDVDPDTVALGDIACPSCGTRGQWTEPREFNMMLKTHLGVIEDDSGLHYLRPETAQGIFI